MPHQPADGLTEHRSPADRGRSAQVLVNSKRKCMHAAIRSYRVMDADAFVQWVQDEFVQQVQTVDGFIAYYVIDGQDDTATTVTIAETAQDLQASTELADRWVVERAAHLVESAPDITAGEIRVCTER
jgi:hypothetical protein